MMAHQNCSSSDNNGVFRKRYQHRKLNMLMMYRDSIERRLAAINASISTLETQIERDSYNENEAEK